MTLSCLLTRLTASRSLLRGQTLRTTNTILMRSTAVLAKKESPQFLASDRNTNGAMLKTVKCSPLLTLTSNRYGSQYGSEPDYKKHSHVMIWQFERILSAALLPIIPAALIMPSQLLDTAVAIMIVMHTHWGLEAIVVDYIRPILFGNLAPKIGLILLYIFSATMLAGLLNLIYNDMGLANSVIYLWKS